MDDHMRHKLYAQVGIVTDEEGVAISPLHDDYEYFKDQLDFLTDPLSDDYCKYDNE